MKRFLHVMIFLVIVSGIVYATDPDAGFQITFGAASFNADLASEQFMRPIVAGYAQVGGYVESRTLGIVGCKGYSSPTRVSIVSDFVIRSASDSTLRRPFAIVLVPRMRTSAYSHGDYVPAEFHGARYPVVGYGGSGITYFSFPASDGSYHVNEYGVKEFWMDICLLLPDMSSVSDPDVYNMGSADDYWGKVTFILQNDEKSESFDLFLRGYYQTSGQGNEAFQLVVIPTNTSIDLKAAEIQAVEVADVHFIACRGDWRSYCLRLSSSPTGGDGDFEFRRENTEGRPPTKYICASYEAMMQEDASRSGNGTGTVTFSGRNDSTMVPLLCVQTPAYAWGRYWQSEYWGEIYVRTKSTQDLIGGAYHSVLYVHVMQN